MKKYKINIETLFTVEADNLEEVKSEIRHTLEKASIESDELDFIQWNAYITIEDENGGEEYIAYD